MKKLSFKKPDAQTIRSSLGSLATRKGGYGVSLTFAVVAVVLVLCLFIGLVPGRLSSFDISDSRIYSVSSVTTDIVEQLDKEVEFVVVVESVSNVDDRIVRLLDEYDSLSPNIYYRIVDCVQNPSILEDYSVNTITAVCAETGRRQEIAFSDVIVVDEDAYYQYGTYVEKEFDGEGRLTSAIDYVTSNVDPVGYTLTGHGEAPLSEGVAASVSKLNIRFEDLDLLIAGSVPEDCEVLLINAPETDLSVDELQYIRDYMAGGGTVVLLYDAISQSATPNFYALCGEFGFTVTENLVVDGSEGYCLNGNPYWMFPEIGFASGITNDIAGSRSAMCLIINSRGFTISEDAPSGITYREFLSTTENGFETYTNEAGETDIRNQGSYLLGAAATKTNEDGSTQDLVLISAQLLDQEVEATYWSRLVNLNILLNSLSWRVESLSKVSIAAKGLSVSYNVIKNGGFFGVIYIAVIPLLVLAAGLYVWIRRRRA